MNGAGLPWRMIVAALLCFHAAYARADELVQVAPQRASVVPEYSADASPLLGYLARPDLPGRLPAVVVLHWCTGSWRRASCIAAVSR
ncbi:MAG TPA: hypothetical protein VGI78_21940 [Acetobacteraceae bacterium]|jgi:hypothetical protein